VSDPSSADPPPARFADRTRGVGAYLGMAVTETSDGSGPLARLRGPFAAPDHVTDAEGRTSTGIIAALVDSIGGLASGVASLPDWIVTLDLTLRRAPSALAGPSAGGPLELETEVLRRGRSAVVTRTEVTGADATPVARGWMTCSVLTPAGGPPQLERPVRPVVLEPTDDPVFARPPHEFFGLRPGTAAGSMALDPLDRLRNPWGIVHGGATVVLAEAAALRAATTAASAVEGLGPGAGPPVDPVVSDLVVHYLNPGRAGPLEAVPEVVGRRGPTTLVRVAVLDRGADDRAVAEVVLTVADARAADATDR